MSADDPIFRGCIPALMTPCSADGVPDFDALVRKGQELVEIGMRGVVYCGSMGDWPLLSDAQRQEGVRRLTEAGVPVVVGTGAQNPALAAAHAAHARDVGAAGLMVIPRVLSRGTSPAAQRAHFAGILGAASDLPAVIYNSPYYGFETKAPLFFDLRSEFKNLVGFKEFGGADSLTYAAEHITSGDPRSRIDGRRRHAGVQDSSVAVRSGNHRCRQRSARLESCDCWNSVSRQRLAMSKLGGSRKNSTTLFPSCRPMTKARIWCSTTST